MKASLIGKQATIHHADEVFVGMIVNETKNTIWLQSDKIRKFIKTSITLTVNNQTIAGEDIAVRSFDRIKKK